MSINPNTGTVSGQIDIDCDASTRTRLDALVATVLYADLFDYALTRKEIHRYLIGIPATLDEVSWLLSKALPHSLPITVHHSFVTMSGREVLIQTRRRREAAATRLWQQAIGCRAMLARLPFIRMTAITGTLAMNNAEADGDIDLFIVTSPGRLWLARAFIIGVVKLAARRGITLCPNYLVTTRALKVRDQNIFTAHELAQMVPIMGLSTYRQMMSVNAWMLDYLPNTTEHTARLDQGSERRPATKMLAEAIFSLPLGALVERWEMRRKSEKFTRIKSTVGHHGTEADFGPDWCKGHFQGHGGRTLRMYYDRLKTLGIEGDLSLVS